jgi:predicted Zn-dependent protease
VKAVRLLLVCGLALGGCASGVCNPVARVAAWSQDEGGEVADARVERVRAIGEGLAEKASCTGVTFHVLRNTGITAYSWPTGEVFMTSGLVDRASDDELAAAIAHELGHLVAGREGKASLRGINAPLEVEQQADAIGCELLQASGRSPKSLVSMLQKVCAAAPNRKCLREIQQRIAVIEARR